MIFDGHTEDFQFIIDESKSLFKDKYWLSSAYRLGCYRSHLPEQEYPLASCSASASASCSASSSLHPRFMLRSSLQHAAVQDSSRHFHYPSRYAISWRSRTAYERAKCVAKTEDQGITGRQMFTPILENFPALQALSSSRR